MGAPFGATGAENCVNNLGGNLAVPALKSASRLVYEKFASAKIKNHFVYFILMAIFYDLFRILARCELCTYIYINL